MQYLKIKAIWSIFTNLISNYREKTFHEFIEYFLENVEEFEKCYDLVDWLNGDDKTYHIDFSIDFNELVPQEYYDNLKDIFELSKKCFYKYKVKNIQELNAIFYKMLYILKDKELIDMSWLDTSEVLSFITKYDEEITLSMLENFNVDDIAFIKFNNIKWCDHPIIIYKDILSFPDVRLEFGKHTMYGGLSKEEAFHSFDGYDKTYAKEPIIKQFPAFEYCINESKYGYKGYLPASGEVEFLRMINPFLNFIFDKINMSTVRFNDIWTSTLSIDFIWLSKQDVKHYAYILSDGIRVFNLESVECEEKHYVIPLFAKSGGNSYII